MTAVVAGALLFLGTASGPAATADRRDAEVSYDGTEVAREEAAATPAGDASDGGVPDAADAPSAEAPSADAASADAASADGADAEASPPGRREWYTFAWPLTESAPKPRGGTTTGPGVTPMAEPAPAWEALQEDGLDPRERDRRAIRALAGEYRTTFDFVETVSHVPGQERARPYQSWATEYVFVIDDEPDFISLQHILVMSYVDNGEVRGPFVQKHWRQDWRRGQQTEVTYLGDRRWRIESVEAGPADIWTQTVYQVDDTPRYAASGRWRHQGGYAVWESERAWRPLPRREHSVRDDYDAIDGVHRISITPAGWSHGQDNLKAVAAGPGRLDPRTPYLAREQGMARYTRIRDFDFSAGRDYWEATAPFWRIVRDWWREQLSRPGEIHVAARVDGRPMFVPMFEYASSVAQSDDFDPEAARAFVERTLSRYVTRDG